MSLLPSAGAGDGGHAARLLGAGRAAGVDFERDLGSHVGAVDDHGVAGPVRPVRRIRVGRILAAAGRTPADVVRVR